MEIQRRFQLRPWLVRALIPPGQIGTYELFRDRQLTYVGRSDTDLRRRLIQHSRAHRAEFFTFDIHRSTQNAFEAECCLFHGADHVLTNQIHPAAPRHTAHRCPFCRHIVTPTLSNRLAALTKA